MNKQSKEEIRNIAIIAHIDHGKTTMLDALLQQSNIFRDNEHVPERAMDSYDQEKERGITIFAKHTCLHFEDTKINIIDTPGHADFSGEVERILGMVNSVLLLIDAQEGPKPQTRFVLSQALKMNLNPIVVLNKIDKPHANPDHALNKTFDLFVELGANDEQLDFPYCYASGVMGFAMKEVGDPRTDMRPLFELILDKVPAPAGNADLPFLMQASTLSYDDYVGRQATGRILEGTIKKGNPFVVVDANGHPTDYKVTRIENYLGLEKVEVEEAYVGDIVSISGAPEIMIGDTLCTRDNIAQLPSISLTEPTVSIEFMVNSGPFVGKDGKHVTMNKIKDRLLKEKKANISLKIEEIAGKEDAIKVCGRGELHLAILIEAMRREDYEFCISKPQVIVKEIDNVRHEPLETAHIEVREEFSGGVIEELSRRKGEMQALSTNEHGITSLEFLIPTRGLMGYRNDFLTETKGEGILTSVFHEYTPWKGTIPGRTKGVLISQAQGKATPYAIFNLQDRGIIFVKPTQDVYEGMVVGEHKRDNDLVVNITREKQLTNVRASGTDENVQIIPAREFILERAIDYIDDDELIEVTPNFIRLRKRHLKEVDRKRKS
ncbi:MAG: GTP-binding protein TypA/BipA [Chlamydiia bacterium]|nr:GTP-binding protein TypA/BipA [Chlamydiia bacterium]